MRTETDPVSETSFSCHLEFWMMEKVYKPSGKVSDVCRSGVSEGCLTLRQVSDRTLEKIAAEDL
jgi:hypothetical protein